MSDYYAPAEDVFPLFRRTDPATSKIAGTSAREFCGDHERRILEALAVGPGTKDEIASRCGLTEQQVARQCTARLGWARRGLAWRGEAGHGQAWLGEAWLGTARIS